ncbi:MAG: response regulator transcription factor [Verrucomicrobiota bacterium]
METGRILIFEQGKNGAEALECTLAQEHYQVRRSRNERRILETIDTFRPHLIVLDTDHEVERCTTFCERIKQSAGERAPRLMVLSPDSTEESVINCFHRGADEYIRKPFSMREAVMRTKTLLRRRAAEVSTDPEDLLISSGSLLINPRKRIISLEGRELPLTNSEYCILEALARRPGRSFTRDQLAKILRNDANASNPTARRNIDVHVLALRRHLGKERGHIVTVRGVGYVFHPQA